MTTFFKVLDWVFVITTILGFLIPVAFFALIAYKERSVKSSFNIVAGLLRHKKYNFGEVWGSFAILVGTIYFAEKFDLTMTLNLTIGLTLLYMAVGIIAWVVESNFKIVEWRRALK